MPPKYVSQHWFCLATWWPYSLIHVCLKEIPPAGHGENTHSPEPSAVSVNHNLTAPPCFLLFISLLMFFFPPVLFTFFFLKCIKECSLYRVAGVHCSYSTPMSHTHPMCLLLATLTKRGGGPGRRRERGGVRKREKGGGGGEWGIWYALCMSDLYKTKRGQIVWMYVRGGKIVYTWIYTRE